MLKVRIAQILIVLGLSGLAATEVNAELCFDPYTGSFICQSDHENLPNDYNSAVGEYIGLVNKYNSLLDHYEILENKHNSIVEKYSGSLDDYEILRNKYNDLLREYIDINDCVYTMQRL